MSPQREWFEKDYYATLGVSKTSTDKEIKKAYRKLAGDLHPDKNPGNTVAEEKFKDVSAAYDVLGDESKRKEYDEVRAMGPMGGVGNRGGGPGGFSFNVGDVQGGGLGDLILRGHSLGRDNVMLAGALPATLLAFYFEEAFGRLEGWATPKGLRDEPEASVGILSVLLAAAVMPLIFGVLLPWDITVDNAGTPTVLTGLHSEYRMIGLPVLLMSLLAALLPRPGKKSAFAMAVVTGGLAIASLIWLLIGIATSVGQLRTGLVLLLFAVFSIALIAGFELVRAYRARQANPARLREVAASA